ncbi:tryptophan halogenase [Neiella marina]|uniref:Tryptophan halogenase n=2 Tax=Neiella marina TaxID=508461 RepID=A0A8J2U429_9GAMM|nr:tryptophan halogenase [Neiella marina]
MTESIDKVVIVGGGTAGWMAAAALSRTIPSLTITLIESDKIGTIGVGEATIPTMQFFNGLLGIDPIEFVKQTSGSYKLGINFENWHQQGEQYFHAFGETGRSLWAAGFHNFWTKAQQLGMTSKFSEFNLEASAALSNKFTKQPKGLNYAYHIDAGKYAKLLRNLAESNGVRRIEGMVDRVNHDPDTGFIRSVDVDGAVVEGDLFIDCSGFKSLLLGESLDTEFVDWSHWLLCDRAIAVQTKSDEPPRPYTRSIANHAGWQWRIPLQHRMGNGIVYCSKYMSDEEAEQLLLSSVSGETITKPLKIRFKTGHREKLWSKNCVAIGLSGGFIEPLESTAIHLIQQGILKLIKLFPSRGINAIEVDQYNKSMIHDYDQIKDFIVLHYKATQRDDSEFWRRCRDMAIPQSLAQRLNMFEETGQFILGHDELFVDSWLQVMIGQGVVPKQYHRVVDEMSEAELQQFLSSMQHKLVNDVARMTSHQEFIDKHCKATM